MSTRQKRAWLLSKVGLFLIVLILISVGIFLFGCSNENDGEDRESTNIQSQITGITVKSSYEYDGEAHGIELRGVFSSDKIYYSSDGENWSESNIIYTDIGQYLIYYKIIRSGYADYSESAILVITSKCITSVFAEDITSVFGKSIVPRFEGLKDGDLVKYSVNGGAYEESFSSLGVGEYVIFYIVMRAGEESIEGSFKLTVLPDIIGTYIGNGKRIIFTDTTAIIEGTEYVISYGIDGSGEILVDGEAVSFSVIDGELEIAQKKYVRLDDAERVLELRINGVIYYVVRLDKSEVRLSLASEVIIYVDGKRIVEFEEYNYCESIIGGSNIRRDYAWKRVEFEVDCDFVDITLSYRPSESIDNIEQKIVYDGNAHAIACEYENVVYWYGPDSDYETTPRVYTEVGKYSYFMFILRDGYLPQPVVGSLTILPDLSGAYVANGSVLHIDGLSAELNGETVDFELDTTELKIDGKAAVFEDGKINFDGVEYVKTEARLLTILAGGTIGVMEYCVGEYALNVTENDGKTQIRVVKLNTNEVFYSSEISGKISSVFFKGKNPLKEWDGAYFISEADIDGKNVAWLFIELEE